MDSWLGLVSLVGASIFGLALVGCVGFFWLIYWLNNPNIPREFRDIPLKPAAVVEADPYEIDWQAEQEARAEENRQRAEREFRAQAEFIARVQAEREAIKTEIPDWEVSIGERFGITSLDRLRVLKAYVRDVILHGLDDCGGVLSVGEMRLFRMPGLPDSRLFFEELSKELTRQNLLTGGRTGPKGRRIVQGAIDRL